MRNWATYTFTVQERPDGTPWVGVDTVGQQPRFGDPSVALRLNLCATYADAREIADFINRRLHVLKVARPDVSVPATLSGPASGVGPLFDF